MPKKDPITEGPAVRRYREMREANAKAAAAAKPAAKKATAPAKKPFSVRGAINDRKKLLDSI